MADLVLHPVEPGADGHGLDLASPVHTLIVGPGLTQGLVQSSLQLLQMILPDIWNSFPCVTFILIIMLRWPWEYCSITSLTSYGFLASNHSIKIFNDSKRPNLLKLPSCHEVLDLPDQPHGVLVGQGKTRHRAFKDQIFLSIRLISRLVVQY